MTLLGTLQFIFSHPLGRQRPLSAASRFVRWQLSSRMGLGPTLVPFVGDASLLVAPGMTGATGNVYVGLHECHDMGFLLHFLRPEDLFADVGANVGSYTVLAGKAVGASCISIEAAPATFERLVDNLHLNRIEGQVDARCLAVGNAEGAIRFSTDLDTMNKIVNENYRGSSVEVPVRRLDDIIGSRSPIAIKIDVEGFEAEVLEGAPRLLRNLKLQAIIMETEDTVQHGTSGSGRTARQMLLDAGFTEHRYDAVTRTITEQRRGIERSPHGNYLFLRDRNLVESRLRSAPMFQVGPWEL